MLFATIGNGRTYYEWTVVFACCCGNSTIFTCKNGHALKAASDTISYFVDMFLEFFRKHQLLSFTNSLFYFEN